MSSKQNAGKPGELTLSEWAQIFHNVPDSAKHERIRPESALDHIVSSFDEEGHLFAESRNQIRGLAKSIDYYEGTEAYA